jgi:integrase
MSAKKARRRGTIVQLGPDRWLVRFTIGYEADGSKIRKSVVVRGTKRAAERRLTTLLGDKDKGLPVAVGKRRLHEWLDEWASDWNKDLAPATRAHYGKLVRHVEPIRHLKLEELSPSHVQSLLTAMAERGVGGRTQHAVRAMLRAALNQALALGYVTRNVAAGKMVRPPAYRAKRRRSLTGVEARAMVDAAVGQPGEAFILTLLFSGARPSEVLALEWKHVEPGAIRIEQALTWPKGGKWEVKAPKTENGTRRIALPASVVKSIEALRRAQRAARLAAGSLWQETPFVFTTAVGTPFDLRAATRRFFDPIVKAARLAMVATAKEAGIELEVEPLTGISPYSFRHTAGSLMVKANVALSVVSKTMGHHDARFTAKQYIHTDDEQGDDASARLAAAIMGAPSIVKRA